MSVTAKTPCPLCFFLFLMYKYLLFLFFVFVSCFRLYIDMMSWALFNWLLLSFCSNTLLLHYSPTLTGRLIRYQTYWTPPHCLVRNLYLNDCRILLFFIFVLHLLFCKICSCVVQWLIKVVVVTFCYHPVIFNISVSQIRILCLISCCLSYLEINATSLIWILY